MHTLHEIIGRDGDVWSLEDEDGELRLMHVNPDLGGQVSIPIDPLTLELFAIAARDWTPIEAPGQNVIPFRKMVPGSPVWRTA